VVAVGDAIEVTVLRIDPAERKIGLSRKKAHEPRETDEDEDGAEALPPAKPEPTALKGGLGGGGPLFSLGSEAEAETPEPDEE
jgi:small subunit ribosomal protein S1